MPSDHDDYVVQSMIAGITWATGREKKKHGMINAFRTRASSLKLYYRKDEGQRIKDATDFHREHLDLRALALAYVVF